MARPRLTLYLDIISPFAYMAFYVTRNLSIFKQCDITYIPIFLGGVMQATGNRPPMQIKNKDKWIALEKNRWSKLFNIPMAEKGPQPFPQPTLNTQRALCAISLMYPDKLTDAFAALYQAFWVEAQTIGNLDVIEPILSKILGEEDCKKVIEKVGSAEAKAVLKENTDGALAEGAFGLPYWLATNAQGEIERYWGFDHLGQVVEHMGLERNGQGFRSLM